MTRSLRTLGLAVGATALLSGATASSAFALNPITVSVSGTELIVNDPTGVAQATLVGTNGTGFDVQEGNSNNQLQAGAGVIVAVNYSNRHWVVQPTGGVTITRVRVQGNAGSDGINVSGVTNVPAWLFGGDGADYLTSTGRGDLINGNAGNDTVYAGSGNDAISGGDGNDTIYGENGDDEIFDADGFADTVNGGNDYDRFHRDAGLDTATNIELYL